MPTLLLVDDHVVFRQSLALMLGHRHPDWICQEAGSLHTALKLLAREALPDLVVLDLSLKDSRGLATLERLRDAHPGLAVLVLSGDDREEQVLAAIDRGACGYLAKTVETDALLQALERALAGAPVMPPAALASLQLAQAFARAMRTGEHAVPPAVPSEPSCAAPPIEGLSERQAEVLRLLMRGKANKEICRELDLAESTVKTHLQAIFRKLDVNSRTQAMAAAARLGLMAA